MFPELSTAAQNDVEEHDTDVSWWVKPTFVLVHVAVVPSAGSPVASTPPCWSTATHSELDGQDTPEKKLPNV